MNESKYQIRSYPIDGINLDDSIINWKNKVFFGRHKTMPENISHGYSISFGPSLTDVDGMPLEDWARGWSKSDAEGIWPILLFFACYHIINPKRRMPIISKTISSAISTSSLEKDAANVYGHSGAINPNTKTKRNKMTHDESFQAMTNTIPLFDKVMSKYENKPLKMTPLIVALLLYQRAMEEDDHLKDFLDLVMVLEALFNDGEGEITFKLAQRTSNFAESDPNKRRELFDKLKKTYKARSLLVHGTDLDLDRYSDYHDHKNFLIPIVQKCLLNYIEKNSKDISKEEIIKELDNIALGI